jgi:hypothetical protein
VLCKEQNAARDEKLYRKSSIKFQAIKHQRPNKKNNFLFTPIQLMGD